MTQEEKISLLEKIRLDYAFPGTPSFDVLTNAIDALKGPWVKTADRAPTRVDANKESKVLGWIPGYGYRGADYKFVIGRPEHVTWWMPFPSRPEAHHDNS